MPALAADVHALQIWPGWVPVSARHYLAHTVGRQSLRALARQAGCHASTILRQVRDFETRRDDRLVDQALTSLGGFACPTCLPTMKEAANMIPANSDTAVASRGDSPSDETMRIESVRILRRLNEPGACMAVADDMENAVVVRESDDGATVKTAIVARNVAQAMALTDWIVCAAPGRIARYHITANGRAALRRFLAEAENTREGFADAPATFKGAPKSGGRRRVSLRTPRYNTVESPLVLLSRRRNRDGTPFLENDLVNAGERLREDFELAQIGPRVTQDWEDYMVGGGSGPSGGGAADSRSGAARERVAGALGALGPGLGDVVLRCCCFLEGMESAEKRMGWSARSGKIVLRIALQRLRDHYGAQNVSASMIG